MASGPVDDSTLRKKHGSSPPNGYNPEMFTQGNDTKKLASLLCSHCNFVLNNAHYGDCGHRFCLQCAQVLNERQCKKCAAEGEHYDIKIESLTPDNGTNKEISRLSVKCPNGRCKWSGFMRDYEDHVADCKFAAIEEYKKGVDQFIGKMDLTNDKVKRLEDLFSVLYTDVKRIHSKVTGPVNATGGAHSNCTCKDIVGYLRITQAQWSTISNPTEYTTPDFYSGRAGYRFKGKALVAPSPRTCVVTFHALQSDYDKVLTWPIQPHVKVTLVGENKNKIETQTGNLTADVDKIPVATSFQFQLADFRGDLFLKFEVMNVPSSF